VTTERQIWSRFEQVPGVPGRSGVPTRDMSSMPFAGHRIKVDPNGQRVSADASVTGTSTLGVGGDEP